MYNAQNEVNVYLLFHAPHMPWNFFRVHDSILLYITLAPWHNRIDPISLNESRMSSFSAVKHLLQNDRTMINRASSRINVICSKSIKTSRAQSLHCSASCVCAPYTLVVRTVGISACEAYKCNNDAYPTIGSKMISMEQSEWISFRQGKKWKKRFS